MTFYVFFLSCLTRFLEHCLPAIIIIICYNILPYECTVLFSLLLHSSFTRRPSYPNQHLSTHNCVSHGMYATCNSLVHVII